MGAQRTENNMANQADNFAYNMKKIWETRSVNALERAEQQGASPMFPVSVPEHWINKPGDQPGYLMVWPDGSNYIVGQDGSWIRAPKGPGRRTPDYIPI
jgi:hypothetical protein